MTAAGQFIQVNGIDMYYEMHGSGRPLVLLHGGTNSSQMWSPFLDAFAANYLVITPDSRGHGKSESPSGRLSYRQMADDTAALIQGLALDRPFVFGWSDGGQIALELGMRYPNLAQALVVGGALHTFSAPYFQTITALGITGPGVVDFAHFTAAMPAWVELLKALHTRDGEPDYWQSLLVQIAELWWTPLGYTPADFARFVDPTLIFLGDRDELIEVEQAVDLYKMIPGAELAILPNATHRTAINEQSIGIILDFLRRHSAAD